jgi:hypothetical protein
MASATTIGIAATANVILIPVATASGCAVVMSIVAGAPIFTRNPQVLSLFGDRRNACRCLQECSKV